MSAWRRSPVIALLIVSVFLVVQLAIPISRLGHHQPTVRFGWQMFSVAIPAPEFVVATTNGDVSIDLEDYMARVRGDIDIEALLPPHLCQVVQGAIRVTWADGSYEC